jgi:hypothetical protein
LQNIYSPIAVVSSLEGFLGRICVGNFPTHVSFSSQVWQRVLSATDNNSLFKLVIALIIPDFVRITSKKKIIAVAHISAFAIRYFVRSVGESSDLFCSLHTIINYNWPYPVTVILNHRLL